MASKRVVLELFSREELLSIAERFELEVSDRRIREQLLEAIASSKKATLAEVLPIFGRERLKGICRELGLDDAGKEKALIIECITGRSATHGNDEDRELPTDGGSVTAKQIKKARVRAGLTQRDLADRLSVSQPTIVNWEQGKTHPTPLLGRLYCLKTTR